MKSLLFLQSNGTALQVRKGCLCVRDSDGAESLHPARVHGLRTIIMAGRGGSFTDEAIRWVAREGVALFLMCRSGECFAAIGEAANGNHRRRALMTRQRQFAAALSPRKRLEIARKIVAAKLRTLGLHPIDARGFRQELTFARSLEDILTVEARAGAAYFMRFRGVELQTHDGVPAHWRTFTARASGEIKGRGGVSKARHAATPFGAMLNYAYSVALGQCLRACAGAGFDPCFGFLHSPKPGRASLAYDVLEFHRADLTQGVFDHAARTCFPAGAFETDVAGVVSLSPAGARDIAAIALRAAAIAACSESAKRIVAWL
ncbi:MAG: CRISPR-associated endonuclease Cas1 [Methylocella sp.]